MLEGKRLILGLCHYEGGQLWYRLENPLRVLEEAGKTLCPIVALNEDSSDDYKGLEHALEFADLVIWHNPGGRHTHRWIKIIQDDIGVPVVADIDDHNLAVTPDNESYLLLGTKPECIVRDPEGEIVYYWKDGATYGDAHYDVKKNRATLRSQLMCLREVTAITVSTFRLQQVLRSFKTWRLNPPGAERQIPIYLLPNMVDSLCWPSVSLPTVRSTVRILWHGGTSHTADLYLIAKALREVLATCPEARLVVLGGPSQKRFLNGFPSHQVEIHKRAQGREAFIKKLVELDVDIGLAPLADTPFNHCKSAVKYLQNTMLGIPTIASAVPPYSDTIEMEEGDGKDWTGLIVNGHQPWVDGLCMLIKSPEMRFTLARNARNWVRWHGDIRAPQVLEHLLELYGGICGLRGDVPGARDPAGIEGG